MKQRGIQVGGTSIIMVFVLLCLTVFAVLTLQSARADARLAEKGANAQSRYYAADAAAEELLAQLWDLLADAHSQAADEAGYRALVAQAAADLPVSFQGSTASYWMDMGSGQRLEVTLYLPWPAGDGVYARRLEWMAVNTAVQEEDLGDELSLFIPGEFDPAMLG